MAKKHPEILPKQASSVAVVGKNRGQYSYRPRGGWTWSQGYANEQLAADGAIRAGFAAALSERGQLLAKRGPSPAP